MKDRTRSPEGTIGELYEDALEQGPVVVGDWRVTAWPPSSEEGTLPEYEVTVAETRIYRGMVKAPAANVAVDLVEDAVMSAALVSGEGVELPLVEVRREARSGEVARRVGLLFSVD